MCRDDVRDGDSDEDRGSGEYYSGEEFHDDDVALARDRYQNSESADPDLSRTP